VGSTKDDHSLEHAHPDAAADAVAASAIVVKSAPTAGAARKMPRPSGPVSRISRAYDRQ